MGRKPPLYGYSNNNLDMPANLGIPNVSEGRWRAFRVLSYFLII